jgi:hypothetical protein
MPEFHVYAFEAAPGTLQGLSKRLCGAAQRGSLTPNAMSSREMDVGGAESLASKGFRKRIAFAKN